jgi:hypothetical protein
MLHPTSHETNILSAFKIETSCVRVFLTPSDGFYMLCECCVCVLVRVSARELGVGECAEWMGWDRMKGKERGQSIRQMVLCFSARVDWGREIE